jgi:chromosome segregation ATPase
MLSDFARHYEKLVLPKLVTKVERQLGTQVRAQVRTHLREQHEDPEQEPELNKQLDELEKQLNDLENQLDDLEKQLVEEVNKKQDHKEKELEHKELEKKMITLMKQLMKLVDPEKERKKNLEEELEMFSLIIQPRSGKSLGNRIIDIVTSIKLENQDKIREFANCLLGPFKEATSISFCEGTIIRS